MPPNRVPTLPPFLGPVDYDVGHDLAPLTPGTKACDAGIPNGLSGEQRTHVAKSDLPPAHDISPKV